MDFFKQIQKPATHLVEVIAPIDNRGLANKGRPAWNKGFDHLDPETRTRINKAFVNSSPVRKGYTYKHARLYSAYWGKHNQTRSLGQWATITGFNSSTIQWHFNRWNNLDRLGKNYHANRAKKFWGKTIREWTAFIDDPKLTTGHVRAAAIRGKQKFDIYLFKKTGQHVMTCPERHVEKVA